MKKIKIFSIVIIMMITIFMQTSLVFANETQTDYPEGIPEHAVKHEIEVEIPYVEEGINPYLWGQETPTLSNGQLVTVATFASGYNYAAFETSATVVSGTATGTYFTGFYDDGAPIKEVYKYADGIITKCDNIAINNQSTYTIKVQNNTGATISVKVTYYTWN